MAAYGTFGGRPAEEPLLPPGPSSIGWGPETPAALSGTKRPQNWGVGYEWSGRLCRSQCTGQPQPAELITRHTRQFITHGGGTRAKFDDLGQSSGRRNYLKAAVDLCSFDQTQTQAGRWDAIALFGTVTFFFVILSGVTVRLFSHNNTIQIIVCVGLATAVGLCAGVGSHTFEWDLTANADVQVSAYLKSPNDPAHVVFDAVISDFKSLTNFVLGLYVR